jgi:hypothetical protein
MQFHKNPTSRNGLCYQYTRDQIDAINRGESIDNFEPVRVTRKQLELALDNYSKLIGDLESKYLLEV